MDPLIPKSEQAVYPQKHPQGDASYFKKRKTFAPEATLPPCQSSTDALQQIPSIASTASKERVRAAVTEDVRLVEKLIAREEAAFRTFYRTYAPGLLKRLVRLTGDAHQAEDCLQQVFAEAISSFKQYRGEGTLGAWLNRIATHIVIDHFRRQQRMRAFLEKIWPEDLNFQGEAPKIPELWLKQEQTRQLVWEVLRKLSPRKRMVIAMCDLEGCLLEDAAKQLEIPLGTVASRLHHGRQEFHRLIQAELRRRGLSIGDLIHD